MTVGIFRLLLEDTHAYQCSHDPDCDSAGSVGVIVRRSREQTDQCFFSRSFPRKLIRIFDLIARPIFEDI